MSGTFTIGEKKVRPGTYFRRENAGGAEVVGATNGIVAAVFQSNWGPLNKEFDMDKTMPNNIKDYYGTGSGAEIIRQAFLGGAVTVRAVRVGSGDGAEQTVTLKTSGDSPADAVKLMTAYPTDRAFTVSVRTNLITDQRQLVIYDGTEVFEEFAFDAGTNEAENLVAAVKESKNFVAKLVTEGITGTLADITQKAMEGGKNPSVTAESYSKGTDVLERYKWNVLIADTDDTAIHTLLQSFAQTSYDTGHLGMICIGGLHTQDFDERIKLAASYNDEKVCYVLSGWKGSDGAEYDGYKAAARIGGMIAYQPTNSGLTHTVIKNATELLEPLTNGEIIKAEQKGCIVLTLNDDDQIWIDNAINTLVTPDAEQDEGWKKIRRTKCRFELMDRINSTIDKYVGKVNNDSNGRATIIATGQKVLNEMIGENKLFPGATMTESTVYAPEGDSCWFDINADDIDSAEHIYIAYRYRFSQNS